MSLAFFASSPCSAAKSNDDNEIKRQGVFLNTHTKLKKKIPDGYGVIFMRLFIGTEKKGKFQSFVTHSKRNDINLGFTFDNDPIVLTTETKDTKNNWSPKADETYRVRGQEIAMLVPKKDRFLKYAYFLSNWSSTTYSLTLTYMGCPIDAPIRFEDNQTYLYVGDVYCDVEKSKRDGRVVKRNSVYIKDGLGKWMKSSSFIKGRLKNIPLPAKKILEGLPESDESDAEDIVWLNTRQTLQRASYDG